MTYDLLLRAAGVDGAHEARIDLDDVGAQVEGPHEAARADPNIVDRHAHPSIAATEHRPPERSIVRGPFLRRELDHDLGMGEIGEKPGELCSRERARRKIHRHEPIAREVFGRGEGATDRGQLELLAEPGELGLLEPRERRAVTRVRETRQRLDATHLLGCQLEHRLEDRLDGARVEQHPDALPRGRRGQPIYGTVQRREVRHHDLDVADSRPQARDPCDGQSLVGNRPDDHRVGLALRDEDVHPLLVVGLPHHREPAVGGPVAQPPAMQGGRHDHCARRASSGCQRTERHGETRGERGSASTPCPYDRCHRLVLSAPERLS